MLRAKHRFPVTLLFLASCFVGSARSALAEDALPLADLVREVDVALLQVGEAAEAQRNLPKLEKAVLEVNTSIKKDANGKISLLVVELGGTGINEYASKVTLTLKPPPPGSKSNIGAVSLADSLRESILAGALAIEAAKTGNPPLVADNLVAAVHFAIMRDGSGKVAVKFPPFEVSGGGGISSSQVQTITVTYKQ
jgi:hypothetical protein